MIKKQRIDPQTLAPDQHWSEIHPGWWNYELLVEKQTKLDLQFAMEEIGKIKSELKASGDYPVSFEQAEAIVDVLLSPKILTSKTYSAIGLLVGRGNLYVSRYYRKKKPLILAQHEQERLAAEVTVGHEDGELGLNEILEILDDLDDLDDE